MVKMIRTGISKHPDMDYFVTDKILFLDIDGVLNNNAARAKRGCDFHSNIFVSKPLEREGMNFIPEAIEAFRYIINNVPKLRIVISSNWRYYVQTKHFFELFALFDIHPYEIDMIDQDAEDTFFKRSFLIIKYLKFKEPNATYIAVDDREDLHHSEFQKKVLFTDPEIGLTLHDSEIIVKKLNGTFKKDIPIKSICYERCPHCNSLLYAMPRGGVECTECDYWFCY
jgi:hypothetical protein